MPPDDVDSVLGDTNRDILLKQVINKSDFNAKRIDEVDNTIQVKMNHQRNEQEKTNKYFMEQTERLFKQLGESKSYYERNEQRIQDNIRNNNNDLGLI